jgi:hypothetical protein
MESNRINNIKEEKLRLNEKTKKEVEEARKGKSISHKEVKKLLRL